jgi:flagellar motor protein MotB
MGTVVMFPNGIRVIRSPEALRLKQQLIILNRCNVADLRVVGFASSAPYAAMNEERNLRLANRRATAVVKALSKVEVNARVDSWKTYEEMVSGRRIRDTDTTGKRIEGLQALNRRAEILWQESPAGCTVQSSDVQRAATK